MRHSIPRKATRTQRLTCTLRTRAKSRRRHRRAHGRLPPPRRRIWSSMATTGCRRHKASLPHRHKRRSTRNTRPNSLHRNRFTTSWSTLKHRPCRTRPTRPPLPLPRSPTAPSLPPHRLRTRLTTPVLRPCQFRRSYWSTTKGTSFTTTMGIQSPTLLPRLRLRTKPSLSSRTSSPSTCIPNNRRKAPCILLRPRLSLRRQRPINPCTFPRPSTPPNSGSNARLPRLHQRKDPRPTQEKARSPIPSPHAQVFPPPSQPAFPPRSAFPHPLLQRPTLFLLRLVAHPSLVRRQVCTSSPPRRISRPSFRPLERVRSRLARQDEEKRTADGKTSLDHTLIPLMHSGSSPSLPPLSRILTRCEIGSATYPRTPHTPSSGNSSRPVQPLASAGSRSVRTRRESSWTVRASSRFI